LSVDLQHGRAAFHRQHTRRIGRQSQTFQTFGSYALPRQTTRIETHQMVGQSRNTVCRMTDIQHGNREFAMRLRRGRIPACALASSAASGSSISSRSGLDTGRDYLNGWEPPRVSTLIRAGRFPVRDAIVARYVDESELDISRTR